MFYTIKKPGAFLGEKRTKKATYKQVVMSGNVTNKWSADPE
jgi:hypothetical protein